MCKVCGSKKILIHRSNLIGEELCFDCYQSAVAALDISDSKKQLEIIPNKALNPDLTGAAQQHG